MKHKIKKNKNYQIDLDKIKTYLKNKDLDYYDIKFEKRFVSSINIENKKIKDIRENEDRGIGIRIYKNQKLGFCSINNLKEYKKIIDKCIKDTLKTNKKTKLANFAENKDKNIVKYKDFREKGISTKAKELENINKSFIKKIKNKEYNLLQSNLKYIESLRKKIFINPSSYIYQEDPHVVLYSYLIGKRNNIVESSIERIGYLGGLEKINSTKKKGLLDKNIRKLEEILSSKPCPAIRSDILITPEISDLLAHEAIGHAAEADAVINNSSILRIEQKLTDKDITIIDDPRKKEFGYFKYDDEGIKAQPTTIIKNGKVNNYLLDIESATTLNKKSNGSARAESYNKMPIVRMSNTYFKEGREKYKDLIENFTGFLLDGFAGGQVDPSLGTFMFGIRSAKKYKKGKLIKKYKQANISGNILNYLKKIDSLTNKIGDFSFGFCGKGSQKANVSGSGPFIKINNVKIGGTTYE